MTNQEIEQLEAEVIDLGLELRGFSSRLQSREPANYDHLGTLAMNLHTVREIINILIEKLEK